MTCTTPANQTWNLIIAIILTVQQQVLQVLLELELHYSFQHPYLYHELAYRQLGDTPANEWGNTDMLAIEASKSHQTNFRRFSIQCFSFTIAVLPRNNPMRFSGAKSWPQCKSFAFQCLMYEIEQDFKNSSSWCPSIKHHARLECDVCGGQVGKGPGEDTSPGHETISGGTLWLTTHDLLA